MNIPFSFFKKYDWMLIGCALGIAVFGLGAIYSYGLAQQDFSLIQKQSVFLVLGLLAMVLVSFFDYRILRNNSYLILILYFICLALLAGLHFFAPSIRGTRGWYRLGFLSFDPIEPAKLVFMVLLAKYFSMRHVQMYKFRHIIFSGVYLVLMGFFIFIKPDLGGVAVLSFIWLGILIVSGIKIKHFLILVCCAALVAGFSWYFLLASYQKTRITAFLFPYDILGTSLIHTQTKISIGSGRFFGTGIGGDSQVQYGFLPEPHTDFIFSAIAEQWGLAGIMALFFLYLIFIWRILKIAIQSQSNFPRLFAVGFAIMLITQFTINIGMNLSLLPVVGIYLPLVSYGGSGLIANFIGIGILQSIKVRR